LRIVAALRGGRAPEGLRPRVGPFWQEQNMSINKPNIILCMTDDQGWGDTGYNGHPVLKTPHLDQMAADGLQFNRFYAAAPVCSPTRGSCLTGRHPYRYGIFFANVGHLPAEEFCLADVLKQQGYTTGHFGKWHLGTLTREIEDGRRGGRPGQEEHYAPPWERFFDHCFSTEVAVPTCDPMRDTPFPSKYWTGPDRYATDNLKGDDSRVIMDRALPFMESAVHGNTPFFAVIWFHAPHAPVVAEPKHRRIYADQDDDKQHYYGCITAMDEQMGRLRQALRDLDVAGNTLVCFCSDNGPAGKGGGCDQNPGGRQQGSPGPFRGRKGSLYEGGVRVPGLMVWPDRIKTHRQVDTPCCSSDYFTTVLDILGYPLPPGKERPYDGVSLLPIIAGSTRKRPRPMGFQSTDQVAFTDHRYKLYRAGEESRYELYDLLADPSESRDIAGRHPEIVRDLAQQLDNWRQSCSDSLAGNDY
jgi:arylsulfatase A-like enzyme